MRGGFPLRIFNFIGMVDQKVIRDNFQGMVGLLQSSAMYPDVDADLLTSNSGRYINDLHPFFTHENFFDCIPAFERYDTQTSNVRAFDGSQTYQKYDLVRVNEILYVSLKDNNTDTTDVTASWQPTTYYSHYFRRKLNQAYMDSVRMVINRKLGLSSEAKTVLNKISIYEGRGTKDFIPKNSRFVGWKVLLHKANLTFTLNQVAVQLSEGQTLNLYIYKANQSTPYKIVPLTFNTPFSMQSFVIEETAFSSGVTASEFYIGYYEDDLVGNAIKRDIDTISMTAGCCNNASYRFFQQYNQYVNFRAFYVDDTDLDMVGRTLSWTEDREMVTTMTNFGINMTFTVTCDLTELIIEQKYLFFELVIQNLLTLLLTELVNSTRNNDTANMLRGLVLSNGNIQTYLKIEQDRLEKRLSEVSLDVNNLDSVCLRHDNARKRIRVGAV